MLSRGRDNKGYPTNITSPMPEFVIDSYAALWRLEKSFRMSKHDLRDRLAGLSDQPHRTLLEVLIELPASL